MHPGDLNMGKSINSIVATQQLLLRLVVIQFFAIILHPILETTVEARFWQLDECLLVE